MTVQGLSPRRHFLRNAGLASAGVVAAVGTTAFAAPPAKLDMAADMAILQGLIGGEHEGIAAYQIAGGSGLLMPEVLKTALTFLGHHKSHRDALAALIVKAGGKPVEPKTDAQYTADLKLGMLKTQADVVVLATKLEKGAANAYVGQVAALTDPALSRLFAQIAMDEAVHWAVLNGALGNAVQPTALLFG